MRIDVVSVEPMRFADGSPVRAASAIAAYGDGWLVAQDDATHGCWIRGGVGTPLRLLPPVDGHEVFAEEEGTKELKPDLESACPTSEGLLLLGSGSTSARMRAVLLGPDAEAVPRVADLSPLYAAVATALEVEPAELNLEGACVVGDSLRWFQRGRPAAGLPTASVDLELGELLRMMAGHDAGRATIRNPRSYDLGTSDDVGLAVTDAVALGGGRVLVSAAAEDSPTAYDDGPVVASALALLDGADVVAVGRMPRLAGEVAKVEGLALLEVTASGGRLLATVDADDAGVASSLLTLDVAF